MKKSIYLSIKQLITFEIVINSWSGKFFLNATLKFQIFSQNSDLFKKSCSLVTLIYAMQVGDISSLKDFSAMLSAEDDTYSNLII